MKKLIITLGVALLCSFTISSKTICKQQQNVWVCSNTTTYHKSSSCIDVQNCTETKTLVTLSEAKSQGKTACGVCFPQKGSAQDPQKKQATKRTKQTTQTQPANNQTATPATEQKEQPAQKKQAVKRAKK